MSIGSKQTQKAQLGETYLKPAIETNKTKISTIDHLASVSSHKRVVPRVAMETLEGGVNQSTRVMMLFVYGHSPENMKIMAARALPPAFQMSIVDCAMEKEKKPPTWKLSPANCASIFTVAPRLR